MGSIFVRYFVLAAVIVALWLGFFRGGTLSEADKIAVVAEARELFAAYAPDAADADADRHRGIAAVRVLAADAVLKADEHPVIYRLNAKAIMWKPEGLYIRQGKRFTEEWGYFVPSPSHAEQTFNKNTDPSYDKIGEDVYRYRIRG